MAAGGGGGGGGSTKATRTREYGLNAPGYFGNSKNSSPPRAKAQRAGAQAQSQALAQAQREAQNDGHSGGYNGAAYGNGMLDEPPALTAQVASLKKELKRANDRLQVRLSLSLSLSVCVCVCV